MNANQDDIPRGMFLAACLFAVLVLSALFVGCASRYTGPDPALFPDKSKEYNDGYDSGFKQGFHEGLIYNVLAP